MQPRTKSNGSKICAFANCKSDGRTLPPDSGVTFIPFAQPCNVFKDEAIDFVLNKNRSTKQSHDTGKCEKCSRALRWISLCRRKDNRLCRLIDVSRTMFVCSKHFVGDAPKETKEDPMPANITPSQIATLQRIGKRKPPIDQEHDYALPVEGEICTSLAARPTLPPCSGLPSVAPTASTPICTEVEEKISTISPMSFNTLQEFEHLPMVRVVIPPPIIIQPVPVFVVSQQPQPPSDIKAFAQRKMMSGWACMINEQFACFTRYDVNAFAAFLEVRVFYSEPQLRCKTFILGDALPDGCDLAAEQQKIVNFQHLEQFMFQIEKMNICRGITKTELLQAFHKIETPTRGKFCNRTNCVRSTTCKSFCYGTKCLQCVKYGHSLGANARKYVGIKKREKSTVKMLKKLRTKF